MKINHADPKRTFYVQDVKLATALLSMGVQLRNPDPIERISQEGRPTSCFFYFEDTTGQAEDLIVAWESKEDSYPQKADHPLNNPAHLFWELRTALRNRERLVDAAKNESKIIHMKTVKGKTYLVTFYPNDNNRRQ
jgi:hypothetical protein